MTDVNETRLKELVDRVWRPWRSVQRAAGPDRT